MVSVSGVVSHGVVLTTALAALVCLPFVVLLMLRTGQPASRRAWLPRVRSGRSVTLDRHPWPDDILLPPSEGAPMPSREQVTAELQRLYRQRTNGTARGSEVWHTAMGDAYDEWLQVACRLYEITHHLPGLNGLDRDLERIRMEAALSAAGLQLPPR